MTVRVSPAARAVQSSSLYVGATLFGLFPSCAHLSFLAAVLRTTGGECSPETGHKVNSSVHFPSASLRLASTLVNPRESD